MKKINTKKYSYIVDYDKIEVMNDIDAVWALAKQEAGLPLTNSELESIVLHSYEAFGPKVTVRIYPCRCTKNTPWYKCTKKTPWYKRVWNFLTKPFKKNK